MSDAVLYQIWKKPPAAFVHGPLLQWLRDGRVPPGNGSAARDPQFEKALQVSDQPAYADVNFVDANNFRRVCNFRLLEASGSANDSVNQPNLRVFHVSYAVIPEEEFGALAGRLGLVAPSHSSGVRLSGRLRIPHAVLQHSWGRHLLPPDPKHPETARVRIPTRVFNALQAHDTARQFLHNYLQALYLVGNNATQQSLGFSFNGTVSERYPRASMYQRFHRVHHRQGALIRAFGESPPDYGVRSLERLVGDNIRHFLRVKGLVFDKCAAKIARMLLTERGASAARTIRFDVGKPVSRITRYEEHLTL